jgi:hypothetical protein
VVGGLSQRITAATDFRDNNCSAFAQDPAQPFSPTGRGQARACNGKLLAYEPKPGPRRLFRKGQRRPRQDGAGQRRPSTVPTTIKNACRSRQGNDPAFKAITSTSLTNFTRSNLLNVNFDIRKQAFGTRATFRDQAGSPEVYPLQSSIPVITSTKGYNTSVRDRSYIPPAIL